MNDVDTLTALLTAAPEDDITAYLLTDALMDERDMTRSEACRVVIRVRQAGFDASDLGEAAALIKADSAERSACIMLIDAALRGVVPHGANIVLVPGDSAPRSTSQYRSNPGAWWYEWTVTLGAAWLTKAHAANVAKVARLKAHAGRRRRS